MSRRPPIFQALERRLFDARESGELALLRERLDGAFAVDPPDDRTVAAFDAHVVSTVPRERRGAFRSSASPRRSHERSSAGAPVRP